MDALPVLARVAELLERHGLEAILIGNAAAALQGAAVTTVDLDFLFRRTRANVRKLTAITAELGATLFQFVYPASGSMRISRDDDGLQVNFIDDREFRVQREAARVAEVAGVRLLVRRFGSGPKEFTVPARKKKRITRKERLEALKKESELAERDQIRRLQSLPIEKRTHFLRKRVGLRMSCI
jgi:hypothetical protein